MDTKYIAIVVSFLIAILSFSHSFAQDNAQPCLNDYFKSRNEFGVNVTDRAAQCLNDTVILDIYRSDVVAIKKIGGEKPPALECSEVVAAWKKGTEIENLFCEKDKSWYRVSYKAVATRSSTKHYSILLIFFAAVVVSLILTIINKLLVNQERVKEIQKRVSEYNKELMKATREKNQGEIERLNKEKPVIMQMQSELMRMQMPVFAALLPFFAVFIILGNISSANLWGEFINLPFSIPLFGFVNGKLGWLGWYILCSIPMTTVFRRALGVN